MFHIHGDKRKGSALIFLETVCIIDHKRCDILLIFWCAYASFNKKVGEKKKKRLRKVEFPEAFR